ncbi:rhomboid family intramembrane serine protease [Parvularcula flava]|uniref:Rhomboid family intramembrane serine protease n=1 Tax=Aquisalinus luteolus TaxID=1566827 RepID=A0ABX0HIG6_9PROT|nr:rhomboid family intramembrane serine protease [Aquisalinus luteolus]NHK26999.1 rhomboid family intramembrane serine protease [Aquisalinus luteolus]
MHRIAGHEPTYTPKKGIPTVIIVLLAINVIIYAVRFVLPAGLHEGLIRFFAVVPGRVASTDPDNIMALGHELLTFITHAFLHGDFGHIGFNCLWLLVFGTMMASRFRVETASGLIVFLSFYLTAAVFCGIVFVFASLGENVLLIGASGALSALMAGGVRIGFKRFAHLGPMPAPPLPILDRRVVGVSLVYILLNLSLVTPLGGLVFMTDQPGNVAWEVHIAGFLFGLVTMPFFDSLAGNATRRGML